jgi:hypothetical protein
MHSIANARANYRDRPALAKANFSKLSGAMFAIFTFIIIFSQLESALIVSRGIWYNQEISNTAVRYIKEISLLSFYVAILFSRVRLDRYASHALILSFIFLYSSWCVYRGSTLSSNLGNGIYALRYIMYLPLIAIALVAPDVSRPKDRALLFASAMFIVIESAIAAYQVVSLPPVYGRTLWGPKVIGTFENPNSFGQILSLYTMIYYIVRKKIDPIILMSTAAIILTGSRLSIIAAILLILGHFSTKLGRLRTPAYVISAILAPIGFYYLITALSSKEISGRDFDNPFVRLEFWRAATSHFRSISDWIFGVDPASYSNSAITVVRKILSARDYVITDSTFIFLLGAFGVMGIGLVALYVATCCWSLLKSKAFKPAPAAPVMIVYILLTFSVTNVLESLYLMWPIAILINASIYRNYAPPRSSLATHPDSET